MKKTLYMVAVCAFIVSLAFGTAFAADFRIGIMQDAPGDAQKYKPIADYLAKKHVAVSFVTAKDYPSAAEMFSKGQVDAMFSGSGVAGSLIIKEVATPVVRPVGADGISTYWAVVLAPKGAPKFKGTADYFKGKKVMFVKLASSGEFYFRSLDGAQNSGATILPAASHGAAIDALNKGQADVAIVKNRVWDKVAKDNAGIEKIGEDRGENPDSTLMVSKKADAAVVKAVSDALLAVEADASAEAKAVKDSLKIKGFIKTTEKDFAHNLTLLKKAGVTKSFAFSF